MSDKPAKPQAPAFIKSTKLRAVPKPGHKDTFPAPGKGWPTFGQDGRIVRGDDEK